MIMVLPGERFILHMQVYPSGKLARTVALSALYSYYGKTVRGLFHTIDVRKSTGISCVSGGVHTAMVHM